MNSEKLHTSAKLQDLSGDLSFLTVKLPAQIQSVVVPKVNHGVHQSGNICVSEIITKR